MLEKISKWHVIALAVLIVGLIAAWFFWHAEITDAITGIVTWASENRNSFILLIGIGLVIVGLWWWFRPKPTLLTRELIGWSEAIEDLKEDAAYCSEYVDLRDHYRIDPSAGGLTVIRGQKNDGLGRAVFRKITPGLDPNFYPELKVLVLDLKKMRDPLGPRFRAMFGLNMESATVGGRGAWKLVQFINGSPDGDIASLLEGIANNENEDDELRKVAVGQIAAATQKPKPQGGV